MKGFSIITFILILFSFTSCENTEQPIQESVTSDKSEGLDETASLIQWKYDMILVNHIKAPVEFLTANTFDKSKFKEGLTNAVSNVDAYNNNDSKSINLGVYGADLGYLSAYEQNQELINYFLTVKQLSEDLSIPVFNAETMEQFESAKSEEGKMIDLIYKKYEEMDVFLVENERFETLTLITCGAFIEGLKLGLHIVITEDMTDESKFLMQQKALLANLLDIVKDFEGKNEALSEVQSSFEDLTVKFDAIDFDKAMEGEKINSLGESLSAFSVELSQPKI
tara:strand:- start:357 stop:1199 length:843 start_codon:yes stop_codon:yes gene_type:complete